MNNKKVAFKIIGIVVAIIVGAAALAVAFRFTILPVWKYNTAVSNAEKGEYALATRGMYQLNYKDSYNLGQEYAMNAAKQLIDAGENDAAVPYLQVAITTGENNDLRGEAIELHNSITATEAQ